MTGFSVKISDDLGRNRERQTADYGMENALAKIVRRNFGPANLVDLVASHFALSDGEARGVVYATASRRTLNKIMRNPRHFGLWLECLADVSGVTLDQYIENQAGEAKIERARWEAREQHLASLEARWRARVSDAGGDAR